MRWLILVLICLGCNSILFAQGYKKKTPEEKARKYTDELLAVIPLDKETEERIFQINVNVSKQFDSLYAHRPEQNEMRKAYAIIFKGRDAAYKEVLTKQQFLMYDDWQRELREKRQQEKEAKEKKNVERELNKNQSISKDSSASND